MFIQNNSPFQKQKGGGTTKACLPLAKIRSMSKAEKGKVVRAKKVGFKRIGISRKSNFVHVGIGYPNAPETTIWTY